MSAVPARIGTMPTHPLEVCVEVAPKKAFASALDWPGWCRAGRDADAALAALADYADRYAEVAKTAGVAFPNRFSFEVVEQVPGGATTAFGAPEITAAAERLPVTAAAATRIASLATAAWTVFDGVVAESPAELRKGPRGGGRDRDGVVAHVIEAERSYARKIGVRHRPFHGDQAAVEACRSEVEHVLRAARSGEPMPGWPARYFLRRAAWHVLDHVWEIEDKS